MEELSARSERYFISIRRQDLQRRLWAKRAPKPPSAIDRLGAPSLRQLLGRLSAAGEEETVRLTRLILGFSAGEELCAQLAPEECESAALLLEKAARTSADIFVAENALLTLHNMLVESGGARFAESAKAVVEGTLRRFGRSLARNRFVQCVIRDVVLLLREFGAEPNDAARAALCEVFAEAMRDGNYWTAADFALLALCCEGGESLPTAVGALLARLFRVWARLGAAEKLGTLRLLRSALNSEETVIALFESAESRLLIRLNAFSEEQLKAALPTIYRFLLLSFYTREETQSLVESCLAALELGSSSFACEVFAFVRRAAETRSFGEVLGELKIAFFECVARRCAEQREFAAVVARNRAFLSDFVAKSRCSADVSKGKRERIETLFAEIEEFVES